MPRIGKPVKKDISTSHVERANLTLRMGQRWVTRLTNAFSKKIENLHHAVSLYAVRCSFCRKHQTFGGSTPAMVAGLSDHAWSIQELVNLLEAEEMVAVEAGALKRGKCQPRRKCACTPLASCAERAARVNSRAVFVWLYHGHHKETLWLPTTTPSKN